ncbi:MAG: hypothetical protein IT167_15305 [Bryobacterales bacterium]|nr:hypothetical protein [Bryobacterales bacterium]
MNKSMNRRKFLMKAAVSGMAAGATVALAKEKGKPPKHDCKGMNDCKGQGGCKTGDNGCAGKNSCKGKGGCSTKDKKKSK